MEMLFLGRLPHNLLLSPPVSDRAAGSRKALFHRVGDLSGEHLSLLFYRKKNREFYCKDSFQSIQYSTNLGSQSPRIPDLTFDRLQPNDEVIKGHNRAFSRYVARGAMLDEEYWTAAWLRAEAHWEDLSYTRHVSSFKKMYAERLKRGQMLTVPAYLVKRRKQHFHHLEQYEVDVILGCNGFIWVGEHTESVLRSTIAAQDMETEEHEKTNLEDMSLEEQEEKPVSLEIRRHICRIANAIRVLSVLGFTLSVELIIDTVEWSNTSNHDIKDMLGAEFCVQLAEREVHRRISSTKKKR